MKSYRKLITKSRLAGLGLTAAAGVMLGLSAPMWAAGPVTEAYTAFNHTRANSEDYDAIYNALNACYQAALTQLNSSAPGSEDYIEARDILAEIHPFLRAGAYYFSKQKNENNALFFASAYVGLPQHEAFQGYTFTKDDQYAELAYYAAGGNYRMGRKAEAIPFFQAYIETGDQKNRKNAFLYMAEACIETGNRAMANEVLTQAITAYPGDMALLTKAINNAIEAGDNDALRGFVEKAASLKPNDEAILNIQGKLYEDTQEFQKALNTYMQLDKVKPNNLQVKKHIALNYYNLGALNHNKAQMEDNSGTAKKLLKQSRDFFEAAAQTLEEVVNNDPSATNYMQALATAYSCLGNKTKLDNTNARLARMGIGGIEEDAIPQMMAYDGKPGAMKPAQGGMTASNQGGLKPAAQGGSNAFGGASAMGDIPKYSEFAKQYVTSNIEEWQKKDAYETVAQYQARVSEATRNAKVEELKKEAEKQYLAKYTKGVRLKNDMKLKPYDAENQVFLVESKYGDLVVPVPLAKDEAKIFESSWNGMQFKNPDFYINNDQILLSALTFVTPTGKSYEYKADKALNYTETVVDLSFGSIDDTIFAQTNTGKSQAAVNKTTNKVTMGSGPAIVSDVDENIPTTKNVNDHTFAVIIANENYSMVAPVPMALNDGETFSKYCKSALGLPENNVRLYKDASYGTMLRAMRDIKDIAKAYDGDIQVIFYYAGHGIPNESTKDAFLLPIDADGISTDASYPLSKLYGELNDLHARNTVVFLDACFSGASRDGNMLASARGVALKPKPTAPQGNMVVFSAASGDETAFPYTEKGHGLFTYFLLKKLQESKGNVELGDLADYINKNVRQQAVVVNHKAQTPSVNAAAGLSDSWQKMKLGK